MTLAFDEARRVAVELAKAPRGAELQQSLNVAFDLLVDRTAEGYERALKCTVLNTRFMSSEPVDVDLSFTEAVQLVMGKDVDPIACNFDLYTAEVVSEAMRPAALLEALRYRMVHVAGTLAKHMRVQFVDLIRVLNELPPQADAYNLSFSLHAKGTVDCISAVLRYIPISRWTDIKLTCAAHMFAMSKMMAVCRAKQMNAWYEPIINVYQHTHDPFQFTEGMDMGTAQDFVRIHTMVRYGREPIPPEVSRRTDHPLYMAANLERFPCAQEFLRKSGPSTLAGWMWSHVRATMSQANHSISAWKQDMQMIVASGQRLIDDARVACDAHKDAAVCTYFGRQPSFARKRWNMEAWTIQEREESDKMEDNVVYCYEINRPS